MDVWITISLILLVLCIIVALVAYDQAKQANTYREMYESEISYKALKLKAGLPTVQPAEGFTWTEKTVTTTTKPVEKVTKAKKTVTKAPKAKKTVSAVKVHDVTKIKKTKKAV